VVEKIHILGQRVSPFVERVYLQAEMKGLLDQVEVERWLLSEIKDPDFLALNPLGKMPVLKWGDFTLYESTVIMEFLEDQFPDKPLLPKDPKERARVRLVVRLLDLYYHPHTLAMMSQVLSGERDQKFIDYHVGHIRKLLNILNGMAGGGRYFVGDSLSLADIVLYTSLFLGNSFAPSFGQDYFEDRPKLKAWHDGLKKLPEFKVSNNVRGQELKEFIAAQKAKGPSA